MSQPREPAPGPPAPDQPAPDQPAPRRPPPAPMQPLEDDPAPPSDGDFELGQETSVSANLLRDIEGLTEAAGDGAETDIFLIEVLSVLTRHTCSEQAVLSLHDASSNNLEVKAYIGFGDEPPQEFNEIHEGIQGWVYRIGTPIVLTGQEMEGQMPRLPFEQVDLLATPLSVGNTRHGAITVLRSTRQAGYEETDALVLSVIAAHVGALIGHSRAEENGREAVQKTLESLTIALDARDPYTRGHSQRVAMYSLAIANELEADGEHSFVKELRNSLLMSALLHDVGKIGIRDEILLKPDKLTEDEYEIIKTHSLKGAEIVRMIPGLDEHVIAGILEHHERWDGRGYPCGIEGEKVHIFGRIIGLADTFDAIVTSRPYSDARSFGQALQRVNELSGSAFDPDVVRAMLRAFRDPSVWNELGTISLERPQSKAIEEEHKGSDEADRTLRRIFGRSVSDLPTLPHVVSQVLEKTRDPNSNLTDIVNLIATDQSLVSTYLRLVNSAFYGFSRRITTLKQAITLLGFRSVRNVVVNAGVVGVFRKRAFNNRYRHKLWDHSVSCAVGARILAEKTGYAAREEAFTAGLLHDIGKVVIDQYAPKDSLAILARLEAGMTALDAEQEILGADHTLIGSWIAERWHLPNSLCTVIRYHHQPNVSGLEGGDDLLKIVAAANGLARIRETAEPQALEGSIREYVESPLNLYEFDLKAATDLTGDFLASKREAMKLFGPRSSGPMQGESVEVKKELARAESERGTLERLTELDQEATPGPAKAPQDRPGRSVRRRLGMRPNRR